MGDAPRFFESDLELSQKSLIPGPGAYDLTQIKEPSTTVTKPKKSVTMADLQR